MKAQMCRRAEVWRPRFSAAALFGSIGWLLILVLGARAEGKEFKVGYVNSERIIAQYEGARAAKKELDKEIAAYEAKAESLRQEYEQAKEEYESQQLSLSEEGKRAKMAEVESRKQRYDSYLVQVYGKNGKIEQKNQELLAPIVEQIDSAVRTVAQQEGFALVVDAEKAGIIFGEVGLDLTELVLEELNRRYAPVPATGPVKKVYAIMAIYDANDEAQRERIGAQIRGFVNALLGSKANVEVLPDRKVDEVVQARGYGSQQIQMEQALDVARALDADCCIFGECSKRERQITFQLSVVDVRTGVLIKSQDGTAERKEVLRERVSSVVQTLYSSINP